MQEVKPPDVHPFLTGDTKADQPRRQMVSTSCTLQPKGAGILGPRVAQRRGVIHMDGCEWALELISRDPPARPPDSGYRLTISLCRSDPATLLMLLADDDRPEPTPSGVRELSLFLTPDPGAEAREVEAAIEEMLLLLEEFCSFTDTIRSNTLQILVENILLLKAKVTEMRGIYANVDRL
ncbi:Breast carcinoma-amplified sequence 4 [Fukomys damarensis]|uniref:Breast carcinoma-amplified sequence 4 n=1 Tax=Fukomys damarensis TaxID=885580 RepID=A0A091EK11_FUKDA|nr:Breast carcinoma-amplified sequence 4 [Fukomys damarensis]